MATARLPSVLRKHSKLISEVSRDSDGCWVQLKDGFSNCGEHSIHEDTFKECALSIECFVTPCDCEQCVKPKRLPIGTEVILASGAHGFVFGHYRREDGSTGLRVTHPDYWAQRRKWDVPECRNYPPSWDCVTQSSVTIVTPQSL